jgi:hypothetical protein
MQRELTSCESEGKKIAVKFHETAKQTVWVSLTAETRGWRRKSVRQLLSTGGGTPIIAKVEPNTPAAAAAAFRRHHPGFNQTPIYNPSRYWNTSANPNEELVLHVERAGSKGERPGETDATAHGASK